jgi:hypothetical protein
MEKSFYIRYKCSQCGKEHVGPPSFAFDAPVYYNGLNETDKAKSILTPDACVILGTDFFIRTILEVPIIGADAPFTWGVWVSQSKDNFIFYDQHFKEDLTGRETFGWLSSLLPEYENTLGLKTTVYFRGGGLRPNLHLAESDHQLSKDFHQEMSIERATEIAGVMLHRSEIA